MLRSFDYTAITEKCDKSFISAATLQTLKPHLVLCFCREWKKVRSLFDAIFSDQHIHNKKGHLSSCHSVTITVFALQAKEVLCWSVQWEPLLRFAPGLPQICAKQVNLFLQKITLFKHHCSWREIWRCKHVLYSNYFKRFHVKKSVKGFWK